MSDYFGTLCIKGLKSDLLNIFWKTLILEHWAKIINGQENAPLRTLFSSFYK